MLAHAVRAVDGEFTANQLLVATKMNRKFRLALLKVLGTGTLPQAHVLGKYLVRWCLIHHANQGYVLVGRRGHRSTWLFSIVLVDDLRTRHPRLSISIPDDSELLAELPLQALPRRLSSSSSTSRRKRTKLPPTRFEREPVI